MQQLQQAAETAEAFLLVRVVLKAVKLSDWLLWGFGVSGYVPPG